jgi:hypothetical protein
VSRVAYVDEHSASTDATPEHAWEVVSRLGGDERFYTPRGLWRVRGRVDRLLGGPGHRIAGTGRPLRPGDPLDFWEVVEVRPPSLVRIRALSVLPGTAYLDVAVRPQGAGSRLTLRTEFEPAGVAGHVLWWAELPAHTVVLARMTRRLAALVGRHPG